jgi:hypothetical protein
LDEKRRIQVEHGAVDLVAVRFVVARLEFLAGGDGEGDGLFCFRCRRGGESSAYFRSIPSPYQSLSFKAVSGVRLKSFDFKLAAEIRIRIDPSPWSALDFLAITYWVVIETNFSFDAWNCPIRCASFPFIGSVSGFGIAG